MFNRHKPPTAWSGSNHQEAVQWWKWRTDTTLDLNQLLHTASASVNLLKTSPSQEWANDIYRWKLGKQTWKQSTRWPILSEAEFVNLPLVESHSSFSASALSPTLPPFYFLLPFFNTFVTHPPKINELDTVVTSTPVLRPWQSPKLWNVHQCSVSLLTKWSFRRRAWIIPKRCRPSGSQRIGADQVHVSIFFGGDGRVGGLLLCHPPYHSPWFSRQSLKFLSPYPLKNQI